MKEATQKISLAENFERIVIPAKYFPTSKYGKIILTIKDNKVVNCETVTSHKMEKPS
jgi:hypothetical protein